MITIDDFDEFEEARKIEARGQQVCGHCEEAAAVIQVRHHYYEHIWIKMCHQCHVEYIHEANNGEALPTKPL